MPDATADLLPDPAHAVAGPGHNNPPESMAAILTEKHAPLRAEVQAVIDEIAALTVVETEEQHDTAVALGKRAADLLKRIETTHAVEKAPLKLKVDAIDAFFLSKGLKGALEPKRGQLQRVDGAYLQKVAAAEQARRLEAARLAQEEADARAKEAAEAETKGHNVLADVKMEAAIAAEGDADKRHAEAMAPTRELSRTFTQAGNAALRTVVKVKSIDRDTVDLEALRPFFKDEDIEAAIRALVKTRGWKGADLVGDAPAKSIKGVVFHEQAVSQFS